MFDFKSNIFLSILFLCRFSFSDAFCSMVTQVSKSLMVVVDLKDKMVIFWTKTIQRSLKKEFSKETFECWHLQHIFNQIYKSIEIIANYLKHTTYMNLVFQFEEKRHGGGEKSFHAKQTNNWMFWSLYLKTFSGVS